MRKLTKKKMKLFGKEVSVFLVVMIGVLGLATAALVPYISNKITGNVVVQSPLEFSGVSGTGIECSEEGVNIHCNDITIHGGESFSVTETASNEADVDSLPFYTVIKVIGLGSEDDPYADGLTLRYAIDEEITDQPPVGMYVDTDNRVTYYYYGYADGNIWTVDYTETGTMTFSTVPNFEPKTYEIEVGTVLASEVSGVTMDGYCRNGTACTIITPVI